MNLSFDLIGINCFLDTAGNRNLIAEDALVRAAGVGKKNRYDEGADAGCWLLAARIWRLETGFDPMVLGALHVESASSGQCPYKKYENMSSSMMLRC